MMAQVGAANPKDTHPRRGKVKEVKQQWAVYEDGAMAHGMQEDEFSYKYGLNRYNRRTARGDVPVAKLVHSKEEERIQKERMLHLEKQNEVAERDAEIARKFQEEEARRLHSEHLERVARANTDAMVARRAYEEEQRRILAERAMREQRQRSHSPADGVDEDAVMASQLQRELSFDQDEQVVRQELEDEQIARQLQEKERKRYERKMRERELAKERKRLEQEQLRLQQMALAGCRMENGGRSQNPPGAAMNPSEADKVLRRDGRLEDAGDFSDFYIKPAGPMAPQEQRELQELQDEELARLLQDQEHKRGAKAINKNKMRHIEETDAQLAKVIYQQEKLKSKKKHRHSHGRQMSEPAESQSYQATRGSSASLSQRRGSQPESQYYDHRSNHRSYPDKYGSFDKYSHQGNRDGVSDHGYGDNRSYYDDASKRSHYRSADELDSDTSRQLATDVKGYQGYHTTGRNSGYHGNQRSSYHDNQYGGYHGDQNPWWLNYHWRGPDQDYHSRSLNMPGAEHHYENRMNERVASVGAEQTPPRAAHYQQRPLPACPPDALDESQLVGRVRVGPEPQSPAPPGYRDPPSYPSSPDTDAYRRSNGAQVAAPVSGNNMFTAIDPTYNQDRDPAMDPRPANRESQTLVQSSPPHRIPPTDARQNQPTANSPPAEATGAIGGEDGYVDLDEVGPVQGQRRSTLTRGGGKKGSKKSSCKQQ